jgi:hypothetical protein
MLQGRRCANNDNNRPKGISRMIRTSRNFLLALAALSATVPAGAAPVRYVFETGPFAFSSGNAPVFQVNSLVAGEIDYDAAAAQTVPGPGGIFVHNFGSSGLSATVQGFDINDPFGSAVVGDEQTLTRPPGFQTADLLVLAAEGQTLPTNIIGFELNGFRLVNVRLFWIEGLLGAPDFLSSSTLPATLPAFAGRLALDFVPVTGGSTGFAFFDGLRVKPKFVPTPEPGSLALLLLGLVALLSNRGRRGPAMA